MCQQLQRSSQVSLSLSVCAIPAKTPAVPPVKQKPDQRQLKLKVSWRTPGASSHLEISQQRRGSTGRAVSRKGHLPLLPAAALSVCNPVLTVCTRTSKHPSSIWTQNLWSGERWGSVPVHIVRCFLGTNTARGTDTQLLTRQLLLSTHKFLQIRSQQEKSCLHLQICEHPQETCSELQQPQLQLSSTVTPGCSSTLLKRSLWEET